MSNTPRPIHGPGKDERATPQVFFDDYDEIFHFTLDACATPRNAKCRRFFTKKTDALKQEWRGTIWMNPPYSQLSHWIRKAYASSQAGATVVGLLPVYATDSKWFHECCAHAEIHFVRGRVSFGGMPSTAPFSSMVVIWRPFANGKMEVFLVDPPIKDEDAPKPVQRLSVKKAVHIPIDLPRTICPASKPSIIRSIAVIMGEDRVSIAKAARIHEQEMLARVSLARS